VQAEGPENRPATCDRLDRDQCDTTEQAARAPSQAPDGAIHVTVA
jgi:hypothetical protein